jgi:CheY-like chemotaxis protein
MLTPVQLDPEGAAPADRRDRRLVLIVDDCADTRTLYSEYLDLAGFAVKEASDGIGAFDVARAALPDVVVMDLGLPGMDGRDVLRQLKADPRTRGIPVVVVSGYPPSIAAAEPAPWEAYVLKPCVPDDLLDTIGRVLPPR